MSDSWLSERLVARSVCGLCDLMVSHIRSVVASSSSGLTQRLARPISSASRPVKVRAQKIISRASRSPMTRGRYWVAPTVGHAPTLAPVWPNTAFSEHTTRSHHSASSLPPPMHQPLTMAMTGIHKPRMVIAVPSMRSFHWLALARLSRIIDLKSPPEENALSPAPVMTAHAIAGLSRVDLSAPAISSSVSSRKALCTSGRLIVSQATSSLTS